MLDKDALKAKIKEAYDSESDKNVTPSEARDRMADRIANAIFDFVKSAQVTVNGVTTAGTATAQTQTVPVTATIT